MVTRAINFRGQITDLSMYFQWNKQTASSMLINPFGVALSASVLLCASADHSIAAYDNRESFTLETVDPAEASSKGDMIRLDDKDLITIPKACQGEQMCQPGLVVFRWEAD